MDVNDALDQVIEPAAGIARHEPERHADDPRADDTPRRNPERDPPAIQNLTEDVAAEIVATEPEEVQRACTGARAKCAARR